MEFVMTNWGDCVIVLPFSMASKSSTRSTFFAASVIASWACRKVIDRQDERHVRMLALILPAYISLLIDESDRGNIPDRALLKEIKLLKKISSLAVCRRCMELLGIECESLIPWGRLARSRSALLVKYAQDR
jgi:hypothetical protein